MSTLPVLFLFLVTSINRSCGDGDSYSAVAALSGGKFRMGTDSADLNRGELPASTVKVDPFVIDKFPVTNENFRKFVRETKFKTEAEKYEWSFVFHSFVPDKVKAKVKQAVRVGTFGFP